MKLADYLTKHQISQSALAAHLGVSQGRVWQWLNGEQVTPKYCPEIEVWSNREVTCEEMNDTVNWRYVRESAKSIADSEPPTDVVDRGAASDDTQALGGTPDRKASRKGGAAAKKIKEARAV
jgi:DNA-binding transcriptional regulator YdaS (Cro superfamily)